MQAQLTGVYDNGATRAAHVPSNTAKVVRWVLGAAGTVQLRVYLPSGVPYIPAVGDTFVLSVKRSSQQQDTQPGFRKTGVHQDASPGVVVFSIVTADTKDLPPGRLVYDVWMTTAAGAREPLVALSPFILGPAASRA